MQLKLQNMIVPGFEPGTPAALKFKISDYSKSAILPLSEQCSTGLSYTIRKRII
jgi:hypothetical protein